MQSVLQSVSQTDRQTDHAIWKVVQSVIQTHVIMKSRFPAPVYTLYIKCLLYFVTISDKTCSFPGSPAHSVVVFTNESLVSGTVASYSCERGFELLGPSRRVCDNGNWLPEGIPFCGEYLICFLLYGNTHQKSHNWSVNQLTHFSFILEHTNYMLYEKVLKKAI